MQRGVSLPQCGPLSFARPFRPWFGCFGGNLSYVPSLVAGKETRPAPVHFSPHGTLWYPGLVRDSSALY